MYIRHPRRHFSLAQLLAKAQPEGKYSVSFALYSIAVSFGPAVGARSKIDVPHSTYGMVGGLDKQIKEVIKPPVRHLELLDALGIAQCKGALPVPPRGAHYTDRKSIRAGG
ncbi:hypothetical protein B0H11DRAFT_2251107 [Mycena galericulata]|nr:hypothetical protein B0H11DRAFT_2251107 [Mycena galericulata]